MTKLESIYAETGEKPEGLIPPLPCHILSVKRLIRVITEAYASVVLVQFRDGFIYYSYIYIIIFIKQFYRLMIIKRNLSYSQKRGGWVGIG